MTSLSMLFFKLSIIKSALSCLDATQVGFFKLSIIKSEFACLGATQVEYQ